MYFWFFHAGEDHLGAHALRAQLTAGKTPGGGRLPPSEVLAIGADAARAVLTLPSEVSSPASPTLSWLPSLGPLCFAPFAPLMR